MSLEQALAENTAAMIALTEALKAQPAAATATETKPAEKPAKKPAPEAPATEPEYVMTAKAEYTREEYEEAGWSVEQMFAAGLMEEKKSAPKGPGKPKGPGGPGAPAADITPQQLNDIAVAKAKEMGDQGAAVMALLQRYNVSKLSELDPSQFAQVKADLEALVPGA